MMSKRRKNIAPSVDDLKPQHTWYTKKWGRRSITLNIDGLEVRLPEMPPLHEMINYGLPEDDCVFRQTKIPKNLYQLEPRKRELIIDREWHRRRNGLWFIIKDVPIYITGQCYTFLNYWYTQAGTLPDFRMEAVNFFQCWMQVVRDPNAWGLYDIKARRIGDTEKALFLVIEHITRVRNKICGMQNKVEKDAQANFSRMINSYLKMPPFFRPKASGKERPRRILRLEYPTEQQTHKSLRDKAESNEQEYLRTYGEGELLSRVSIGPSDPKYFDGEHLLVYHGDEPGKWTRMNVLDTWAIVKLCLAGPGMKPDGKAILTTTVENFENAETLENARNLWDLSEGGSGPETSSGLRRVLRDARYFAPVDHWGFHRGDEFEAHIKKQLDELLKKGFADEYVKLKRKMPFSIEDVFTLSSQDCILNPAILDRRATELREGVDQYGNEVRYVPQRYTLVWKNGDPRTEQVEAILDPNGFWSITQMPVRPNAHKRSGRKLVPGNSRLYGIGADPIDHVKPSAGSDFAMAVYRVYDPLVDAALARDEHNEILPDQVHKMDTDQYVCIYTGRHDDPYRSYEDSLKTAIFYGAPILFENNKPGAGIWVTKTEDGKYSKYAAQETLYAAQLKKVKSSSPTPGQPAVATTIANYTESLLYHIKHRNQAMYHLNAIQDMRQFSPKTRTKCDITVACGFAIMMATDNVAKMIQEEKQRWDKIPLPQYA